jgi:hypothetical protein
MIHALGDSHAIATFGGISSVTTYHVGPVTMYRAGHGGVLPEIVGGLGLQPEDVVIFCFGEIDVRCHVKMQSERQGMDPEDVLRELATSYLTKIATLDLNYALPAVLAVVPPVPANRAVNPRFPVVGTDAERSSYTIMLNRRLIAESVARGVQFVDIYTPYADASGMLRPELSDGCVHLRDPEGVRHILAALELRP